MGLTNKSTGSSIDCGELLIDKKGTEKVIALGGNPNVGKSTVFNALTGLNQHTGNWPGKTVTNAQGRFTYKDKEFILVDIPGTYSLMASSLEEEVARNFICFGGSDLSVIVVDATCLERNLNLVLQVLEYTTDVVVCVNLIDEARKKKIMLDLDELSLQLGVPVIATNARAKKGLDDLLDAIYDVAYQKRKCFSVIRKYDEEIENAILSIEMTLNEKFDIMDKINTRWLALKLLERDDSLNKEIEKYLGFDICEDKDIRLVLAHTQIDDFRDRVVGQIVKNSEEIYRKTVKLGKENYNERDRKIDKILTSKSTGIPIMILMLGVIFWITIAGANYPSSLLSDFFFFIEDKLADFCSYISAPEWVTGVFVYGIYRTLAWVISVMLPPMAIFFPLFTLLEDVGYLPRVAFNMDKFFKKANAHGKQSLTMCMGFGCNACGVIGCRIIDSPRERLIAILTNNFVPCNGRFPTLIAIITMFFAGSVLGAWQSVVSTLMLTGVIILGVVSTLLISKLLSKTVLKGMPSSFALEMPPFRAPKVGSVIVRSIFDRTLFVLGRAVMVAAPAGLIIWLCSNIMIGDSSILAYCTGFLDPFARLIGLDGVILMAFILGFPANEIVVPIIIMSYLCTGRIIELDNLEALKTLLVDNGWTISTAICTMLFSLFHFPCATTCLTIRKETQSLKWTFLSVALPTAVGIAVCFLVNTLLSFII